MDNLNTVRTALSEAAPLNGTHSLAEIPLNGKINLRGNPDDPAFLQAIESRLGIGLPIEANTLTASDGKCVFWLGPDEWLIHLPLEKLEDMMQSLRAALTDQHHALTDVSDYYSVVQLSGPQARQVVRSASPLDIRAQNFKQGQCAQTLFGHASILIWPIDQIPSYGVQVRWSYAQYLYDYLADSIRNTEMVQKVSR